MAPEAFNAPKTSPRQAGEGPMAYASNVGVLRLQARGCDWQAPYSMGRPHRAALRDAPPAMGGGSRCDGRAGSIDAPASNCYVGRKDDAEHADSWSTIVV